MTSGNVTSVSPNLMVNNQLSAKDGDKSGGFLDVMSKNVAKSDKKADTQNQVSGNDVKDDKAKVDKTKAQTPDDKKVTTKDNKADKDVNHFSDAKNAEATKDTSKADTANEATVVEEPAMEEAPVAMATMEEIPAEVIAIVDEALDNFANEVAKLLDEALNITEDELEDAMSTLNITFADLLNPKEVTQLMVEVADVEDSVTLVLDEDLSDALSTVRDLATKVVEETGVDAATIKDIAASANKVNESFVEIPKEMNMQMATEVETDVKIQQPVEENVVKADVPKDVAPKMAATEEVVIDEPEADVTPVVVNKDSNAVKNEENKELSSADEATDDVFVKEEVNTAKSDNSNNSGNMTRHEHDNRAFTANVAADVQNVQPETTQNIEARPVLTRFQTMQMITQISEQARINISREVTSIEMILNPESLGKIYLNVSQEKGAMKAHLVAQNEVVKEALEQQMIALKDSLNKAGVKVEAVEVSVGTHEFERNLEEGMHQQEEQSRQQEEQASQMTRRTSIDLNNLDELQGLMSEEDKLVAQMMKDHGNSVNYMA